MKKYFLRLLLIGLGVVCIIVALYMWQQTKKISPTLQSTMKTYVNTKYGYQIEYPDTLAIREFPDSGTGAGFRPADKPSDPQYEVITVDALAKTGNIANLPLAEYAKIGASQEIQNYTSLNSIHEIKTASGEVGYETTWLVAPMVRLDPDGRIANKDSKPSPSLPITYFALPNSQPPATVHVTLSDSAYQTQYNEMITTFSLLK